MRRPTTGETQIKLLRRDDYPYELLLEADPSRAMIEKYINESSVFALSTEGINQSSLKKRDHILVAEMDVIDKPDFGSSLASVSRFI